MTKIEGIWFKIIDRLSVFFKMDLRYIARGGALLSITQVTSAIFGFISTLIFANYLPQEVFGVYKYILSTYALIALLSLPGLDTALIETLGKGNLGAFPHALKTKFKWGLLGTLGAFLFSAYSYIYAGDVTTAGAFFFVGIFLPFMESMSIYTTILNTQKRYGFWTITEFFNQIFSVSSLYITLYFTHDVIMLIISYFLTYILVRTATTSFILRKFITNNKFDKTYMNYGVTMSWYQLITRGIASMDQMVLFHYMGPVQVAIFSIAQAVPSRMQSLLHISGTLAFPKVADKDEKYILRVLPSKMLIFGGLIFLACTFYALIAPYFFKLFFPKYIESIHFSQLLIFYTVSGLTYPFGSFLVTHRKVRENYIFAIVSFVVKVLTLIILVPLYGVWGAVWSVVLSSWSTIILTYLYIFKEKYLK